MCKYALYSVPDSSRHDHADTNYKQVVKAAKGHMKTDSLEELLKMTIGALNDETISTQNWHYVTDEEKQIILYS